MTIIHCTIGAVTTKSSGGIDREGGREREFRVVLLYGLVSRHVRCGELNVHGRQQRQEAKDADQAHQHTAAVLVQQRRRYRHHHEDDAKADGVVACRNGACIRR